MVIWTADFLCSFLLILMGYHHETSGYSVWLTTPYTVVMMFDHAEAWQWWDIALTCIALTRYYSTNSTWFYVPERSFMYLTVSCWFLISFVFKLTALCTILPHCVQSYCTVYNLTAQCTILPHCVQSYCTGALKGEGWALKPLMYSVTTEPLSLAYLGPMYIKIPMEMLFIRPWT